MRTLAMRVGWVYGTMLFLVAGFIPSLVLGEEAGLMLQGVASEFAASGSSGPSAVLFGTLSLWLLFAGTGAGVGYLFGSLAAAERASGDAA